MVRSLSFPSKRIRPPSLLPKTTILSFKLPKHLKEANAEVLQLQKLTRPYKFHYTNATARNPTHLNISNLSLTTSSPVNKTICSTSFLYA